MTPALIGKSILSTTIDTEAHGDSIAMWLFMILIWEHPFYGVTDSFIHRLIHTLTHPIIHPCHFKSLIIYQL